MSSRRRDDRDDRRPSRRSPPPPRRRDSRSRSRSPRRDTRRNDRDDDRDRRDRPRDHDRDRRRSRSPPRRDDRDRERRRSRSPPRRDGDRDRRRERSPPRFERARGPTGPRESSRERGGSQPPPPPQPAGKPGRARAVDLMDDPPRHSDSPAPTNGDSRMAEGDDEQDEDAQMMAIMGFAGFDSSKGKGMDGNQDGAVDIKKRRTWRQYMNRRGGFNRPLDRVK